MTQKGKGYAPAEAAADKYPWRHPKFNIVTGEQAKSPGWRAQLVPERLRKRS